MKGSIPGHISSSAGIGLNSQLASEGEKKTTGRPHFERWAYRRLYRPDIFALATRLYPFLGRPGFQLVSRSVALAYALTQSGIRHIVRDNLSLLRKQSFSAVDAIKVFANFGATIADYVALGGMTRDEARALCVQHDGVEHLQTATADGKGVILVTAHFSFFEFGPVVLDQLGYKVSIATLPEPSAELTAWRAAWRERWGTETIAIGGDPFSSIQVIRALESGRCMAMLADRPPNEHGLPFDLPNGRTLISTAPAILSRMTGCSILPALMTRLPGGSYRIVTKPPIKAQKTSHEERDAEIARCTREMADSLFEEIRRAPHQWYQFVPVGL